MRAALALTAALTLTFSAGAFAADPPPQQQPSSPPPTKAETPPGTVDDLYKRGTDLGAAFLAEHAARLWLALTLEECGDKELADRVAKSLPKSQQFALAKQELMAQGAETIAQVTRAYVVGYETGVRTEFRRHDDLVKSKLCAAAKGQAAK